MNARVDVVRDVARDVVRPRAWGFDELIREGMSLIPAQAPAWTNHNASDPGITLVELLAYCTELLAFRLERVTPQAKLAFLRLLEGRPGPRDDADEIDHDRVDAAIAHAVDSMSRIDCIVSAADLERAAADAAHKLLDRDQPVRTVCVTGADLQRLLHGDDVRTEWHGQIGVAVIPRDDLDAHTLDRLCADVQHKLAAHCLMGTEVHVVGPTVLHAAVAFRIVLRPGADAQGVLAAIDAAFRIWPDFEAAAGGNSAVRVTDLIELIDNVPGVDHVEDLAISSLGPDADGLEDAKAGIGVQIAIHSTLGVDAWIGSRVALGAARLLRDDAGRLASIELRPWEVVRLHLASTGVEVVEQGSAGARTSR